VWDTFERQEMRRQSPDRATAREGSRPRPAEPAGTDLLPQIRHIVVLMMENHSYDNYLGTLPNRGEGLPLGADGQPAASNAAADGRDVRAYRLPSTVQHTGVPTQSWHAVHQQWADGKGDGFVTSAQDAAVVAGASPGTAAAAMGYWTDRDLPFYHGLAGTFPLADHWFSSCLGPTFPNRRFLLAGTAHGLIDDSPYDLFDYPPAGTVFDLLTDYGISWANYHPVASEQSSWRHYFRHRGKTARRRLGSLARLLPAVAGNAQKDIKLTADIFPLGIGRYRGHVRGLERFFTDADQGTLPAFSIVDPDFESYSEENPQDIRKGESFAAEVVTRVMRGPGWPHTLLIWLYDEHGGYYDHVPPPAAVPPDDVPGRSVVGSQTRLEALLRPVLPRLVRSKDQLDEGPQTYDRYGFRVPAVIVSPYARPDYVSRETFDHASVLKLVEEKWNLPALTARDAAARAPLDALDLTGPPAFLTPPDLPAPGLAWGSW
jgi:phospholipase C